MDDATLEKYRVKISVGGKPLRFPLLRIISFYGMGLLTGMFVGSLFNPQHGLESFAVFSLGAIAGVTVLIFFMIITRTDT